MIDRKEISKIYAPVSNVGQSELIASLERIPAEYFEVTRQIVEYAEVILDTKLKANIYYSLADHLNFAIDRYNSNLTLGNRVFWKMKTYYPTEFQIGVHALSIIKNNLDIELPKEEAANIVFHIINASNSVDNSNVLEVSSLVDNILQTLRVLTHGKIKQEGINYDRFVTHIKFFSERYISGNMLADDPTLLEHVFESYQEASQIGLKLEKTIYTLYEK
ncbi:BglG family transcriptional antiterminator [Lactobacillus pasteurii DSM 23907 = CRBIP 24.76]|uniref:BglG family transcriptional antiterminator n=2 Tax=Lactobacillus pasteurii TaxID=872327 RepID=I7IZ00_9LACO|nr:BglG family transcriptional antiterminator [Lactobacillus pasteurii DSM 23907 = CRBIP 24.76]